MSRTWLAIDLTQGAQLPAVREGVRRIHGGKKQAWVVTGPIGERCISIPGRTCNGAPNDVRYITVREGCHIVVATLRFDNGTVDVYQVRSTKVGEGTASAEVSLAITAPVTNGRFQFDRADFGRYEEAVQTALRMLRFSPKTTYTLT